MNDTKKLLFLEYLKPTADSPNEKSIRAFMVNQFDKPKDLNETADNYKEPGKEFLLELLDDGLIEANRNDVEHVCSQNWLAHRGEKKFQFWFDDFDVTVKISDTGLKELETRRSTKRRLGESVSNSPRGKVVYKNKLEHFLVDHEHAGFNGKIYSELYLQSDISDLFTAIDFFEITYAEYLFFYRNRENYVAVIDHFGSLSYDDERSYYILLYLSRLINIEYADVDNGKQIIRYDDIILNSCAFVNNVFQKVAMRTQQRKAADETIRQTLDELEWKWPKWDKNDFKKNYGKYREYLNTCLKKGEHDTIYEVPCFELRLDDVVCARLLPEEYFNLITFEVHIPKVNEEPDWDVRLFEVKKIKSNIKVLLANITTIEDIGKRHKKYFDLPEILQKIDDRIENIELAVALRNVKKRKGTTPNICIGLFKPDYDAAKYLAALKKATPPVLNEQGEFIAGERGKSNVIVFFDVLDRKGITVAMNAKEKAKHINALIPGLDVNLRTLQNPPGKAGTRREEFEKLISNV